VHGNERHSQQKLVLHQRAEVEARVEHQQVFLGTVVLGVGGGLIVHETEPPVHLQGLKV
jgi:hypothetical protein